MGMPQIKYRVNLITPIGSARYQQKLVTMAWYSDIKRPILHFLTAVCLISLCFNFSGASEVDVEDFGAGSGPIWLDQLSCPDGASDLSSCQKNAWGDHDCGHSEDTGIRCIAPNEGGMYPRRI